MKSNPLVLPIGHEAPTAPPIDRRRSGHVDAILFGRVIDALESATIRLARSSTASRFEFARLDGEVEGIAIAAGVLSGEDPAVLRQRIADRVHRIGQ